MRLSRIWNPVKQGIESPPAVGVLAWDPMKNGKNVIRCRFGLYYET